MRTRVSFIVVAVAVTLAACGSGSDDSVSTAPDITLIPATSDPELFEEGAGGVDGTGVASSDDTTDVTDTSESTNSAPEASSTIPPPATTQPAAPPQPGVSTPPGASSNDPAPAETSTTVSAPAASEGLPELTTTGIGSTTFGADPDGTVAFVNTMFGQPSRDTGWIDAIEIGACFGSRIRQVAWGDLQLEFGDVSDVAEGRDHFYAYTYGRQGSSAAAPSGLATPENITVGSTVGQLLNSYPGVQLIEGDDFFPPSFSVNDNLNGNLSGLTGSDFVEVIIGGLPCDT